MTQEPTSLPCIPGYVHCPACDLAIEVHAYAYRAICPECRTLFDLVAVPLEEGSGGGNKQEIKGEPPPGHGAGGKSSAAQNAAAPAPGDEEGARINSARVRAARAPDDGPGSTFVPETFSQGGSA